MGSLGGGSGEFWRTGPAGGGGTETLGEFLDASGGIDKNDVIELGMDIGFHGRQEMTVDEVLPVSPQSAAEKSRKTETHSRGPGGGCNWNSVLFGEALPDEGHPGAARPMPARRVADAHAFPFRIPAVWSGWSHHPGMRKGRISGGI